MRELRKAFIFCFNGLKFDDIVRKNLEDAGFNTIMYYENVDREIIKYSIEKMRIPGDLKINLVIIYSGQLNNNDSLFRDEIRKNGFVFLRIKKSSWASEL